MTPQHGSRAPTPPSAEEVLAWSGSLRRLAVRLAPDEAAAEDLLQDAWLASLEARSAPRAGWLPWMKGALRLASRDRRRGAARRDARERASARAEAQPAADETVARLEMHAVLLRELRALPEPYRTALVARWLEERSIADIAARTDSPPRTVETRLARGLALLRLRLERAAGGGGETWLTEIAGLLVAPHLVWILMQKKHRVLLVALVLSLSAAVWVALPPAREREDRISVAERLVAGPVDSADETGPPHAAEHPLATNAREPRRSGPVATAVEVRPPLVRGRIVDAAGEPIRGAQVALRALPAEQDPRDFATPRPEGFGPPFADVLPLGPWREAQSTRSAADGRFGFDEARGSTGLALAVHARGFAPLDVPFFALAHDGRDLGDLVLVRGVGLAGRVVDERGVPIAGAQIAVRGPDDRLWSRSATRWLPIGESDENGGFSLDGWRAGPFELRAEARGRLTASVRGDCVQGICDGIEIVLAAGARMAGRVVAAGEHPLPELEILAEELDRDGRPTTTRASAPVAADGAFEFIGLAPGAEWLVRARRAGEWWPGRPFTALEPGVRARTGDDAVVVELAAPIEVTFRAVDDATGEPIRSAATARIASVDGGSEVDEPTIPEPDGTHRARIWTRREAKNAALHVRADGFDASSVRLASDTLPLALDLGELRLRRSSFLDVRVVDPDGAPVEGARVVAVRAAFDPAASNHTASIRHIPPVMDEARTDARGEARLTLDRSGRVTLTVEARGCAQFERGIDPVERTVEVRLAAPRLLTVRVLGDTEPGLPVRLVRLAGTERNFVAPSLAATDPAGRAHFEAMVGARYAATVPLTSAPSSARARIEFEFTHDGQEVTLALPPTTYLSGRVTQGGRPVVAATVRGRDAASGDGRRVAAGVAVTDDAGRFLLDELAPGVVPLVVEGAGPWGGIDVSVELVAGANHVDLDFTNAEIRGRVVDDAGGAIVGLRLLLESRDERGGTASQRRRPAQEAVSDGHGRFRFEDVPPAGSLRLAVAGESHVHDIPALALAPGETRDLGTLVLTRAAELTFHVAEEASAELGFVRIDLESAGTTRRLVLAPSSPARAAGLAPGRWTATFKKGIETEPFLVTEFDLEPGAAVRREIGSR